MVKTRNLGIDTLRGVACLLLVALHIIGEQPEHGLRVADDHPLALFTALFFHLRMPMFAMLSGFVYAYRPVGTGGFGGFMAGKLRRLGLPFLFAAGSFWAINTALGGGYGVPLPEAWKVFLQPYAQFWFLQSIIVLFAVIAIADTLFPRSPFNVAVGFLVISGALFLSPVANGIEWFSLERTFYLAPFFAFGIVLNRIGPNPPRILVGTVLVGLLLVFTLNALNVFADPAAPLVRRTAVGLSLGLCFSGFLILKHFSIKPLAWIGHHSFTIYLYHMFPVMALQMAYEIIFRPEPYVGLALGLTAGIAGPIVLHLIVERIGGWPMLIALGLSPKKAKPAPVEQAAEPAAQTPAPASAPNPLAWPEAGR